MSHVERADSRPFQTFLAVFLGGVTGILSAINRSTKYLHLSVIIFPFNKTPKNEQKTKRPIWCSGWFGVD